MMNPRFTDSPTLISLDLLAKLDAEPAGTYLYQTKYDGVRRQIWNDADGWHYRAKNRDDAMPMHKGLQEEFEALPWPQGIGLDCEVMGRRDKDGVPMLYIFDLWMFEGKWRGGERFDTRQTAIIFALTDMIFNNNGELCSKNIKMVDAHANPGMVEAFAHQMTIEGSEGLVIRRADSTIIGNRERSVENPNWFKTKFIRVRD